MFQLLRTAVSITFVIALTSVSAHAAESGKKEFSRGAGNKLYGHPSPYLALHGDDPVDWNDWNEEVMARAKREGKLVFVSSGYFSCHWCHVMQRESYQDSDVAKVLNESFVSVKLDRELNPALDKRLMDFAQATQGRGGWPLNVYLTPEGFPLYAHMYQPATVFGDVLGKLKGVWKEQQPRLQKLAREAALVPINPPEGVVNPALAQSYAEGLVRILPDAGDSVLGGFGNSNKFPMSPQLEFYLDSIDLDTTGEVREFLELTLDSMATGGLRDHIGGGFFRYTTDPDWETPHFEKMLYTNAQLAQLFLRAAPELDRPDYIDVARDTWDFMLREMETSEGAMVASFSAIDDDNIEGGHYLWAPEDVEAVLDEKTRAVVAPLFGLDRTRQFPDGILPMRLMPLEEAAERSGKSADEVKKMARDAAAALFEARQARSKPTDTKLLAGWNGLVLDSFAEGAKALNDKRYADAARRVRDYLINTLWHDGKLRRAIAEGQSLGQASVQDYAYVARGLWRYAELTGDGVDLDLAAEVALKGFELFNRDHGWYLTEESLIMPEQVQPALEDGALPSPSAVLAETATALATALGDTPLASQLHIRAQNTLSPSGRYLENNLFGFASYVRVMRNAQAASTAKK